MLCMIVQFFHVTRLKTITAVDLWAPRLSCWHRTSIRDINKKSASDVGCAINIHRWFRTFMTESDVLNEKHLRQLVRQMKQFLSFYYFFVDVNNWNLSGYYWGILCETNKMNFCTFWWFILIVDCQHGMFSYGDVRNMGKDSFLCGLCFTLYSFTDPGFLILVVNPPLRYLDFGSATELLCCNIHSALKRTRIKLLSQYDYVVITLGN